jgi:hypothetical protein
MRITLYKSMLCPRCHLTGKYLRELTSKDPEIEVEEIDIMAAPRKIWRDGIRMIPALKIDNHILSALFISKTDIVEFIDKNKS